MQRQLTELEFRIESQKRIHGRREASSLSKRNYITWKTMLIRAKHSIFFHIWGYSMNKCKVVMRGNCITKGTMRRETSLETQNMY